MKLILEPGELTEKTCLGMTMSSLDFVKSTLQTIVDQSSSGSDFNNFSSILHEDFLARAKNLLKLFIENYAEVECYVLLADEIAHWINFVVQAFFTIVAGLSGANLTFQDMKREQKESIYLQKWNCSYDSALGQTGDFSLEDFGLLGYYLYNILFMNWSYFANDSD